VVSEKVVSYSREQVLTAQLTAPLKSEPVTRHEAAPPPVPVRVGVAASDGLPEFRLRHSEQGSRAAGDLALASSDPGEAATPAGCSCRVQAAGAYFAEVKTCAIILLAGIKPHS
jgi:hypothetical protein